MADNTSNDNTSNDDTSNDEPQADLVRVQVDDDSCIGAGLCEMSDPDVFVLDDEEVISRVIGDGLMLRDRAIEAADQCPGRAISFVEIGSGPV